MQNKIIFFDIDGTLLSHRNFQIPDSTRAAILQARANGHLLFINTGRSFAEIDNDVKGLGFDGYVCGCGTYIRYQEQELLKVSLSSDVCRSIVNDLLEHEIEAVLEGTETIYFNDASKSEAVKRQRDYFINYYNFQVRGWDAPDISFDKFSIWNSIPEETEAFLNKYADSFHFIRHGSSDEFVEIIPMGYSKASGIKFLIQHLNIPHENTYALGDSANDLPMLTYVKHSIGMGNSDACISDIVSFMTKDVDQDGVAHALKHYQII